MHKILFLKKEGIKSETSPVRKILHYATLRSRMTAQMAPVQNIYTDWNLSNTDDLSYFLSIIVAVVYGKFAVIQFWQNL